MLLILFLIITYLIGSIPFGLLVSKIHSNKDIRNYGSNNIGATNVTRILGKKLGFLTFALDSLKGALMLVLAKYLFSSSFSINIILVLTAIFAVIGHIFPIYLKFKGGKGVATSFAVIMTINPISGSIVIIIWLVTFLSTRISALASLLAILSLNLFAIFYNLPIEQILLNMALLILIFAKHLDNIIRLRNGKENKIK